MEIREFQELIARLYLEPDSARGLEGTYMWFAEEVGELTRDLRRGAPAEELAGEFADVFAWLASLANMTGIDLEQAVRAKYLAGGVPGHHKDLGQEVEQGAVGDGATGGGATGDDATGERAPRGEAGSSGAAGG